jgi:hypothetical protein
MIVAPDKLLTVKTATEYEDRPPSNTALGLLRPQCSNHRATGSDIWVELVLKY